MIDDPLIRTLSVNGERRIAAFQLTGTVSTGVFIPANAAVPPHYVLAGPASGDDLALMAPRLLVAGDVPFAAILSSANVFGDVNTFPGVRFLPKVVTSNYDILPTDSVIVVSAEDDNILLRLPFAQATGQTYRIKRIDDPVSSGNTVLVQARTGEQIDGVSAISLDDQFTVCSFVDGAVGFWDKGFFGKATVIENVAILDQNNVFTGLNTFAGVCFAVKTVTSEYTFTFLDFAVYGDATDASFTVFLPPATGSGQVFRLKKIDPTSNIVTLRADGTDTIDGSASVALVDQWANIEVQDGNIGYWDNTRPPANALLLPDTPPATPATLNEVIALLQSYGLCA